MGLKRVTRRPGGGISKQPKLTVLYVEDDDTNWAVAELALGERYKLIRATNSTEAINAVRKVELNVILMDIELAGSEFNGIELTQILKGTYDGPGTPPKLSPAVADIPVVFMTAYASRYTREDLLRVGGDELMTKPVNFTGLALTISRLLMRSVDRTSSQP